MVSIFNQLCRAIEASSPSSLEELYVLTHAATERFNELQNADDLDELDEDWEIEATAREAICEEFDFVASAYGFEVTDDVSEELVAPRDW